MWNHKKTVRSAGEITFCVTEKIMDDGSFASEIEKAIASGCFRGLTCDSTEENLYALMGPAESESVKKGVKTAVYPEADFLFENHRLCQVTLKISGEDQRAAIRSLWGKYGAEEVDRLPPYFRCFRLAVGNCAVQQVLITTAYAVRDQVVSVGIVFPKRAVQTVSLDVPQDIYRELTVLSNATRRTVQDLAVEMIAAGLKEIKGDK